MITLLNCLGITLSFSLCSGLSQMVKLKKERRVILEDLGLVIYNLLGQHQYSDAEDHLIEDDLDLYRRKGMSVTIK